MNQEIPRVGRITTEKSVRAHGSIITLSMYTYITVDVYVLTMK